MEDVLANIKRATVEMSNFFDNLNVKLMGSYEEIEAYEKTKESSK